MMYKKYISIVIIALLIAQTTLAQIRIAVVTDVHVMGPGLVVNDGKAWQTALNSDRKMLDKSREIFDRLIDLFALQKPDLLLVTGDLTKDGERLSHQYVKAGLDKLRAVGIKAFVIPGNHDLGTINAVTYDGDKTSRAETVDINGFRAIYADYGYGMKSSVDSLSLSYVCEPVTGLTLIGIDSHKGYLSEATLDWVCQQAEEARRKGQRVIAMMHHPLIPRFNGANLYISTSVISNSKLMRNRLADAGVRIILTGHLHTSDISKDWNEDLSREIYDINTGSAVSYPCDYRIMTLNKERSKISVTTRHINTLPSDAVFTKTAKERLYSGIYAKAYNIFKDSFSFSEKEKQQFADIAARTFIVHAEGNEGDESHAEAVEQIFFDLNRIVSSGNMLVKMAAEFLKPIMDSVFKDATNYEDPEREDCTDDLMLSIDM